MEELKRMMDLLGISEEDAMNLVLSGVSPSQPGGVRQAWRGMDYYGRSAPSASDIWGLYVEADFRCTECGSQVRTTVDHIDGNPKNHDLSNLRVLCLSCNLARRRGRGVRFPNRGLTIYRFVVAHMGEHGEFPTNRQILDGTGIDKLAVSTYLVKYLRARLVTVS